MIQLNENFPEHRLDDEPPKFDVGQIVRHKRYGYRGVIVAVDGHCRATPEWYFSNKSQPDRAQPWYHVLVDGSATVTYPAESNLRADDDPTPVDHPLLELFFHGYDDGRYLRNDTPWPET